MTIQSEKKYESSNRNQEIRTKEELKTIITKHTKLNGYSATKTQFRTKQNTLSSGQGNSYKSQQEHH